MRQLPLQYALIWHDYLLVWICGTLSAMWPLPGAFCAFLLVVADKRLWRPARFLICCALWLAAFAYAGYSLELARKFINEAPEWLAASAGNRKTRVCGAVESSRGLPDQRLRVILSRLHPVGHPDAFLEGFCAWTWERPLTTPLPGQQVCLSLPVKEVHGFANDNDSSYEFFWFAQKIYWRMWSRGKYGNPEISGAPSVSAAMREKIRGRFLSALADGDDMALPQAKAILLALIFGDRGYLSQSVVDDFSAGAIAHSLALSGQHLCVAGFLGLLAVLAIARLNSDIYLKRPKILLAVMASLPFAAAYLWIGNAPPSLIRAACMLVALAFWLWRCSIFSGLDLLCAALFVIILYQPLAIFDTGLQLSALCVAAITLAYPALARLAPKHDGDRGRSGRIAGGLGRILIVSLVIQLSLSPLTLLRFHMVGLWFPLNALWLPLLGIVVLPVSILGLLLACLPFDCGISLAAMVLDLAARPCQWLLDLLGVMAGLNLLQEPSFLLPHWTSLLAFALLASGLAWLFGNNKTLAVSRRAVVPLCIALSLLAVGPFLRLFRYFNNHVELHALDVGQGQSILINYPHGGRLLVDGGGNFSRRFDPGENILAPYLSKNAAPELAAVINTHPDLDHLGGLFYLLKNFRIGKLFHNGEKAADAYNEEWLEQQERHGADALKAGDTLVLGNPSNGIILQVLHPPGKNKSGISDKAAWKGNDSSIVLRLVRNGRGLALLGADAEKASLRHLADNVMAELGATILVAPHHGSDKSLVPEFYKAARPSLVLVSCGFRNRWGYPGKKLSAWLAEHDIPLLDTGNSGRISIIFKNNGEYSVFARPKANEKNLFFSRSEVAQFSDLQH